MTVAKRTLGLALAAGMLAGCAEEWAKTGELVLAERGRRSAYTIVLPGDPSPSQVTAAGELRQYIEQMTGVELPIATNATPMRGIFLGNGAADLGDDGFRLRATPPHFRIEGGRIHGTLFGVYDFLERYCGCEWFSPTTSEIPKKDRLAVSTTLDDVQKPAFKLRDMNWTDQLAAWTFTAKLKMNGFRTVYPESLGGQNHAKDISTGAATFDNLCPPARYFKDHPDWFSLVKGERRGTRSQRCLTNSGFVDFLTSNVLARLRRSYPASKYYPIYPNDWKFPCECPTCKALDEKEGTRMASLLQAVNAVAERVTPQYPDAQILTFAYLYTLKPPKTMKVHPNVMICYCTDACSFSRPLAESRARGCEAFVRDFREWRKLTGNLYIWDYSANFEHLFKPFECCHVMPENFRLFRDTGVVGVFEEGNHYTTHAPDEALKTWLIGHLLWNPNQTLEPLLDRFFRGYYGAAAEVARGYYDALVEIEKGRDETKVPLIMWGLVLNDPYQPASFFETWSAKWDAALELVKDDPVRRDNVYWARHNVNAAELVRAMAAGKYNLCADRAASARDIRRLQPIARRVLADYEAVPGLKGLHRLEMRIPYERAKELVACDVESFVRPCDCVTVPATDLGVISASQTKRVDDPKAVGGKAIRIDATAPCRMMHAVRLEERLVSLDPGVRLKVRIHARVERTDRTDGNAFSVGTCDLKSYSKRDLRAVQVPVSSVTDDGYAWYDIVGVWQPAGNETLWIGNGDYAKDLTSNPSIRAVYIDQVELSRDKEENER